MTASILLLGFFMGLRHAVEADHVAAVGSLAAGVRQGAVRLGTFWGLGHAAALFAIGVVFIAFDWGAPETFSSWVELAVGGMLVWLGASLVWRLVRERIHFHIHEHDDGIRHFHAHSHKNTSMHDPAHHPHAHMRRLNLRALVIGVVHGMAGSAALVVLALGAVQSVWQGVAYIALFGIGSIVGMALLSLVISVPMGMSSRAMTRTFRFLQGGVGLWTIGLGGMIVFESVLILNV